MSNSIINQKAIHDNHPMMTTIKNVITNKIEEEKVKPVEPVSMKSETLIKPEN